MPEHAGRGLRRSTVLLRVVLVAALLLVGWCARELHWQRTELLRLLVRNTELANELSAMRSAVTVAVGGAPPCEMAAMSRRLQKLAHRPARAAVPNRHGNRTVDGRVGTGDPLLCGPAYDGDRCQKVGVNTTAHCKLLYVDVGANIGQSLQMWYSNSDKGHGAREFGMIAPWQRRRRFCSDVFEASPSFGRDLARAAAYHRARGKDVRLYVPTPLSIGGGEVAFASQGFVVNGGGTLSVASSRDVDKKTAKQVMLQSVDAVEYVRAMEAVEHLVLKIDVENYEFQLLRGLVASGVLCKPGRRTDVLVEWHLPRQSGDMFNATTEGLPLPAREVKEALVWMLAGNPACPTTHAHVWW